VTSTAFGDKIANNPRGRHIVVDESYSTEERFATGPGSETKNVKNSKALEDITRRLENVTANFDRLGLELESIRRRVQEIAEDLGR
jgi:archaellum component FlaC